jgi:UDP-N-acetylmuramoylalanine--D-glutamate ligase
MTPLPGQRVYVLGHDSSGAAACALLRTRGAEVRQLDLEADREGDLDPDREGARDPGTARGPEPGWPDPDRVILSAACKTVPAWVRDLAARGVPVIGERELAFELGLCLHVAVTGDSGKSTTARLIVQLLRAGGRRVDLADAGMNPACGLVEASRDLDLLVHAVEPEELDHLVFFRPVVGVLLNLRADPAGWTEDVGNGSGVSGEVQRAARLFARQQAFDWAIVQNGALARLKAAGLRPPGKVVTFDSREREADLGVERGLLVSRWEGWSGPLWDMDRGRLRGPHFAEDILAALAVGRVLRIPLEEMTPALAGFEAGRGRMESVGEADGVRYVDDGRAASLLALEQALLALAPTPPGAPYIVLVAGGDAVRGAAYDLGPLLSSRVRQARLFGAAAPALQAAWNLFTPCSVEDSLLNAVRRATNEATPGEVVLFCPACPCRERAPGSPSVSDPFLEVAHSRLHPNPGPPPPGTRPN